MEPPPMPVMPLMPERPLPSLVPAFITDPVRTTTHTPNRLAGESIYYWLQESYSFQ